MSTAYVPADTIDEIREAMKSGATIESLAIRIGIDRDDRPNWPGTKTAIDAVRSLN